MAEVMCRVTSLAAAKAAFAGKAAAVCLPGADYVLQKDKASELPELFKYCRLRGLRVCVELGSFFFDAELSLARAFIKQVNLLGADALMVCDLGIARIARQCAPDLELYGGPMLAQRSVAGARALKKLGFSRVFLSSGLSWEDVRFIAENGGIETQILGVGALCPAFSGSCCFSALYGGGRESRGKCPQPCREKLAFFGDAGTYLLNMKHLSLASHGDKILQSGVTSVLIDGDKRPEYAFLASRLISGALAGSYQRSEEEKLAAAFAPEGLTGYCFARDADYAFCDPAPAARRNAKSVIKEAQRLFAAEKPSVPLDFKLTAGESRFTLRCRDGDGNEYLSYAPLQEFQRQHALNQKEIEAALRRQDDTVFFARNVEIDIPGAPINANLASLLRKKCLDGITAMRRQPARREDGEWNPGARRLGEENPPKLILSFRKLSQISAKIVTLGAEYLYVPLYDASESLRLIERLGQYGIKIAVSLPEVLFDGEWRDVLTRLRKLHGAGVKDVVCQSAGQLNLMSALPFNLRAGENLRVFNSQALREVKSLGAQVVTLSPELSFDKIKALSKAAACELVVYGRVPLMVTQTCAIKRKNGACICGSPQTLVDKNGRAFPLTKGHECRNVLYSSEKLYFADKMDELSALGLSYIRLNFTTENERECLDAALSYTGARRQAPERTMRGLYYTK